MKALIALLALSLSSCAAIDTQEVESKIIDKNDTQLRVATKAVCSSALTAIARELAGNPDRLTALLVYCGWSKGNIKLMEINNNVYDN